MTVQQDIETLASTRGDHVVASITVTDAERDAGALDPAKLDTAERMMRDLGYIRVENLLTEADIDRFRGAYDRRYGGYLRTTNKKDMRPLFTVDVREEFADRKFLSNAILQPLFERLLGNDYIIAAVSSVCSFPGAPDQHLHRDARALFGEKPKDFTKDTEVPAYSLTMLVPLVDFTTETGCTRVWPGTHRIGADEDGLAVGSIDPEVRRGSVLITDGRTLHRGAANRSKNLRPLIYCTYQRSWYRDFNGYQFRPPFILTEASKKSMPEDLVQRMVWAEGRETKTNLKYMLRRMLPASLRTRLAKDI
ncbi:hypothetical protein HKCCE3408_05390 [Rhodobacterales bacterium HKCCE3408]|nr:hypothetical protein [Rhodobacterales bacterium HKCCE3408]